MQLQNVLSHNVPLRADGWEVGFLIPKQFSTATMASLQSNLIAGKARHEIVQEVTSRMLNYCLYPTSKQYDVVASKLINAFPCLTDKMNDEIIGTGFVSSTNIFIWSLPTHTYRTHGQNHSRNGWKTSVAHQETTPGYNSSHHLKRWKRLEGMLWSQHKLLMRQLTRAIFSQWRYFNSCHKLKVIFLFRQQNMMTMWHTFQTWWS